MLTAFPESVVEAREVAAKLKEYGNDLFRKGRFNNAIDCYDGAAHRVQVAHDACAELRREEKKGTVPFGKEERAFEADAILLHAQIHTNRAKALIKLSRWEDARQAAQRARLKVPDFKAAIKAGAAAALAAKDLKGKEFDILRHYAARFSDDSEAAALVAAWEEAVIEQQGRG